MEATNGAHAMEPGAEERPSILVVDDEPIIREVLSDYLASQGYLVQTAENGARALEEITKRRYHLVMTDLRMPVMGGAELLAELARRKIKITVIVMTAYATVETAIQTMKDGAYDYVMKPFKIDEITLMVERALEKDRLERENIQLKEAQRLYQISEAMSSTLSLDKVLRIIVESAKREADACLANLVLRDPREDRWSSEICDTDIGNITHRDLDDLLDLHRLEQAHAAGTPVLFPPLGLNRFVKKPLPGNRKISAFVSVPLAVRDRVTGMLNVFSFTEGNVFQEGQRKSLYILASRAANALENARLHEELKEMFLQTIEGFAHAIDAKDPYTHGHSRRVTLYCEWIGHAMGLDERDVGRICHAATLHDIGKIGLRLDSLNKPAPLTDEERETFRTHPAKGCKILGPIRFFDELIPIIYHHHEHWDGSGYPEGWAGEKIPLGARILAVADAYDAMTSDRAYRQALKRVDATRELDVNCGKQFDPRVVEVFLRVLEQRSDAEDISAA